MALLAFEGAPPAVIGKVVYLSAERTIALAIETGTN